jgi:hypothetical protein
MSNFGPILLGDKKPEDEKAAKKDDKAKPAAKGAAAKGALGKGKKGEEEKEEEYKGPELADYESEVRLL